MKMKSCVAAATLCMFPILSQAGVIYEWHALDDNAPYGLTLRLEFEKKTVKEGAFTFYADEDELQYGGPWPELGLIRYGLSFPLNGGMYFHRDFGYTSEYGANVGYLHMDVAFSKKGFMEGSISAFNFETSFSMSSENGIFTIHNLRSDAPMDQIGCDWRPDTRCGGATGYFRRVDIPEPTSIALIALGATGLAATRRRKSLNA